MVGKFRLAQIEYAEVFAVDEPDAFREALRRRLVDFRECAFVFVRSLSTCTQNVSPLSMEPKENAAALLLRRAPCRGGLALRNSKRGLYHLAFHAHGKARRRERGRPFIKDFAHAA